MTVINKIESIRRSISWVILGMLGTLLLVNVLGALSPFWAVWRYESAEQSLSHSRDLLELAQVIGPWFSSLFIVAAWHLGKVAKTPYERWIVVVFSVIVSGTFVGELLFDIPFDSPIGGVLIGFQFVSLLVFMVLVRRYLRVLQLT